VGQFERAFRMAEKKGVPRTVHAGTQKGIEGIREVLEALHPTRLMDGWGVAADADVQSMLFENAIPLDICMKQAIVYGLINTYADYPLRDLLDAGLVVVLGSDLPTYYQTTLNDEYLAAVEHCGLAIDELEQVALNALRASQLPEEEKSAMIAEFTEAYAQLREEHLSAEAS
jgi:adenosine deaminase